MRFAALAVFFVAQLAWVSVAQAQSASPAPVLDLGLPFLEGSERIPVDDNVTTLQAPWTYTFPTVAASAAMANGGTTLEWSLACTDAEVTLVGPTTTVIAYAPGEVEYSGVASFGIVATPTTRGMVPLDCVLSALAGGAVEALQAADTVAFAPEVVYAGGITATAQSPRRLAGPQRMIRYPIDIKNNGNARVSVVFEVIEQPDSKWHILAPESVIIEPGAEVVSIATVATPFDNGYNADSGAFLLRAQPTSADDKSLVGEPVDVVLSAQSRGWYIPGPSSALLVVALALLAWTARRG